jgi:hypothetical protein
MGNRTNTAVLMVIALALAAWFLMPLPGDYQLKSGHAVCPTKDDVVAWRGARLLGGGVLTASVANARSCTTTSAPLRVLRRSTVFDLPYRVSINGRVMYADHDALVKI